jgi:hypothetical protein
MSKTFRVSLTLLAFGLVASALAIPSASAISCLGLGSPDGSSCIGVRQGEMVKSPIDRFYWSQDCVGAYSDGHCTGVQN